MEYGAGSLTPYQLEEELKIEFEQSGGWEFVRRHLPDGAPSELPDALPIRIEQGADGFDPASASMIVAAIVAVSPVVQKVVLDLWEKVWLPRILARKGEGALGDPKES